MHLFFLALFFFSSVFANEPCISAVSGSPFTAPNGTRAVSFSPIVTNLYLASIAANSTSISVSAVDLVTGILAPVSGSPFSTPSGGFSVAFSPYSQNRLFAAVANYALAKVSIYEVNTTSGSFTPVPDSPVTTGMFPKKVAFTPVIDSALRAVVLNSGDNTITTYQVNTVTGSFSSPQTTNASASNLTSLSISPLINNKIYVAAGNGIQNYIELYTLDIGTGILTPVAGSPFSVSGSNLRAICFSPVYNNTVYALVANSTSLQLFSLNSVNDSLTLIQNMSTDFNTLDIAFSPVINDTLFAASTDVFSKLRIYAADRATGNLTQLSSSPPDRK